jgi:hypothetical protein
MTKSVDIEGRSKAVEGGADSPPAPPAPHKDISEFADPHCKRCYGTGRTGFMMVKGERKAIACRCAQRTAMKMALDEILAKQKASKS